MLHSRKQLNSSENDRLNDLVRCIKRLQHSMDLLRDDLINVQKGGQVMANVINIDIPFNVIRVNPCNGENVAFSGTIHEVVNQTATPNGMHFTFHLNTQDVMGVGQTTGARYVFVATENQEVTTHASGAFELTVVLNLKVFGQGNVPNFLERMMETFIVNANGEITVSNLSFSEECQGGM